MFDDDDDDNPIGILILGVLAAVLSIIIWQFIQDDAGVAEKYAAASTEEVAAAAPEPTAVPVAEPAAPAPTEVPVVEPAAPAVALDPIDVTGTLVGGGSAVILEGLVPDEETRAALVGVAIQDYGQENVEDRLVVSDQVSGNVGLNITLEGGADTPEARDKLRNMIIVDPSQMANPVPVNVADNVIVAEPEPEPEPPVDIEASLNNLFQLEPIQFDSGSARIRAESDPTIDSAAELLIANPGTNLVVEGHTDSKGSQGANQSLSDRRAEAVRNALIDRGVSADRLTSEGFGESEPIADNATLEGRQLNRRIEFRLD